MTARRWITIAILGLTAAACSELNPVALAGGEAPLPPPTAPTDTSGFVPEDAGMD